jgi:hypothetical protein
MTKRKCTAGSRRIDPRRSRPQLTTTLRAECGNRRCRSWKYFRKRLGMSIRYSQRCSSTTPGGTTIPTCMWYVALALCGVRREREAMPLNSDINQSTTNP